MAEVESTCLLISCFCAALSNLPSQLRDSGCWPNSEPFIAQPCLSQDSRVGRSLTDQEGAPDTPSVPSCTPLHRHPGIYGSCPEWPTGKRGAGLVGQRLEDLCLRLSNL